MASKKTAERFTVTEAIPLEIETPCLICGEGVPVFFGAYPKICEKCKAAVMKVREQDGK